MDLILYKNNSSPAVASKALSSAITVSNVLLKAPCTIERPVFTIQGDGSYYNGYNYLYSSDFGRYYFAHFTLLPGGIVQIDCVVDPLTTYESGVRSLTCMVERQEAFYNPYIADSLAPIQQGSKITAVQGDTVGDAASIYLTCVGAVPSSNPETPGGGEIA